MASAIRLHRDAVGHPMSVGVVGLGTGTLACHSDSQDDWRFYEIDPAVVRVARDPSWFTFLSRCLPDGDIVLGDARQKMAQERSGIYDIIVVDAFSSDAIPVHLMTREALGLFFDKLAPGGILVMHISNRHMELESVVAATAAAEGLQGVVRTHAVPKEEWHKMRLPSHVAVLARNRSPLAPFRKAGWSDLPQPMTTAAWTDDYANVLAAILRKQGE